MIAVVAAHGDDEMLGCGGAIARATAAGQEVQVVLVADGTGARADEAPDDAARRAAMAAEASRIVGAREPIQLGLPDNRLDGLDRLDLVQRLESVLQPLRPREIWTHHAHDLNVDHRRVTEAVLTAFRPQPGHRVQRILAFEVLSSTGWAGGLRPAFDPRHFIDIADTLERKLDALRAYGAEMRPWPHARSYEAVTALARMRGSAVGLEAAEAFEVIRQFGD